jgi:tetratricopeptide (TPR) repeat protein
VPAMGGFTAVHLQEIDEITDGRCAWRPVRHHLGIKSFGINAWTGRSAGDRVINEHDEADLDDQQEELYFVYEGRARFELDGESVDAPAGTFVFVTPAVRRTAFAEEAGTTIVSMGATPGRPYVPVGWEVWAEVNPLYEAGDYAAAADRAREIVDANPEYVAPLYNVACCESLAGRPEEAIEHLRRAITAWEPFRAMAVKDSDFDPIRQEPGFRDLVGETKPGVARRGYEKS